MIVNKVLVQRIIISVNSVHAPQCSSVDSQKHDFYESLINVVIKLGEKEIVVIAGFLMFMFGSNPENYQEEVMIRSSKQVGGKDS